MHQYNEAAHIKEKYSAVEQITVSQKKREKKKRKKTFDLGCP